MTICVRIYADGKCKSHLMGPKESTICGIDLDLNTLPSRHGRFDYLEFNDDFRLSCTDCKRAIKIAEKYQKGRKAAERGE